jgi:hypothetical protein
VQNRVIVGDPTARRLCARKKGLSKRNDDRIVHSPPAFHFLVRFLALSPPPYCMHAGAGLASSSQRTEEKGLRESGEAIPSKGLDRPSSQLAISVPREWATWGRGVGD